jgi:peptidoglycan pentaglycine glycine transferase (the first glycine)
MATVDVNNLINITEKVLQECNIPEKKFKLENRVKAYKEYKNQELVVSSYVNIHYGDKSWYLYGANDMTFKDTFANYKLFDYQIEHSKAVGAIIFDEFGTIGDPHSTKPVAGLHEFKKKFGGEYTEFIGEFTYIINPFMYFVFDKLVVLYRKPMKFLRHLKVKLQKR